MDEIDNNDILKLLQNKTEETSSPEVMPDDRLKLALEAQNKQKLNADLLRSFQQMIGASTGAKVDTGIAESIEKRASDPMTAYKTITSQEAAVAKAKQEQEKNQLANDLVRRKLQEYDVKMEDAEKGRDPNSNISKASQDMYMEWSKLSGRPYNEQSVRKMTGDELISLMPEIQKYAIQALGERQSKRNLASQEKRFGMGLEAKQELAKMSIEGKKQLAEQNNQAKPTEGEKTIDREFAKVYNQWSTGGKADYEENKKIFDEAIKSLEAGKVSTGTASGIGSKIPVVRTDTKELETRVRKALNSMLRATLGAQFTENEGERIFQQTFDPFASPEENVKNMQTELNKIEKRAQALESQGAYFKQNKSLTGYTSMVKMRDPKGVIRMVPSDMVEKAKAAGGEVVE